MPESRTSLTPIRDLLDKALESERGIKITCTDEGKAINLLYRLRAARKLDMEDANKVYGDPKSSPYYTILCSRVGCVVKVWKGKGAEADGIKSVEEL